MIFCTIAGCSHLKCKSDVRHHIVSFLAYTKNQFQLSVKAIQADNGHEFVNHTLTSVLDSFGILLRLSCPYTSPQNGKAKCVIRTTNNVCRTLLIHAHMTPPYWAEAALTVTYLLNRRPCSTIENSIPFERLFNRPPTFNSLRVFGCLCYPNLTATTSHELAPYSTACVFIGYPTSHKGYRCLELSSKRIIIS
jgi:transposase InsO family protein